MNDATQIDATKAGLPRLENRVSFLAHRINAKLIQSCNPVLNPHDLDLYSSRIVFALSERGSMKVGELVELMALPQSTMSHQLKRLEKSGILERNRSRTDNRTVVITLTDAGKDAAKICANLSEAILGYVEDEFDAQEVEVLKKLMKRLFDCLPQPGDVKL
jgi:DNA-binding MarR family transcriptional regulator